MTKELADNRKTSYGIRRPSGAAQQANGKPIKRYVPVRMVVRLVLVVAVVGGIITGIITISDRGPSEDSLAGVKSMIGKHYLLPANEEPALATIVDKNKINSEFFKQAENGDRVLIYQKNRIAIIYRPSIDRIVAVGPVTIDTPKGGTD